MHTVWIQQLEAPLSGGAAEPYSALKVCVCVFPRIQDKTPYAILIFLEFERRKLQRDDLKKQEWTTSSNYLQKFITAFEKQALTTAN